MGVDELREQLKNKIKKRTKEAADQNQHQNQNAEIKAEKAEKTEETKKSNVYFADCLAGYGFAYDQGKALPAVENDFINFMKTARNKESKLAKQNAVHDAQSNEVINTAHKFPPPHKVAATHRALHSSDTPYKNTPIPKELETFIRKAFSSSSNLKDEVENKDNTKITPVTLRKHTGTRPAFRSSLKPRPFTKKPIRKALLTSPTLENATESSGQTLGTDYWCSLPKRCYKVLKNLASSDDELSTTDSDDSSNTDSSEEALHNIPLPAEKKSNESIIQNPLNVKDATEHEDFKESLNESSRAPALKILAETAMARIAEELEQLSNSSSDESSAADLRNSAQISSTRVPPEHVDSIFTIESLEPSLKEKTGTVVHKSGAENGKYPFTAESTAVYSIVHAGGVNNWNFLPMRTKQVLKNLAKDASAENSSDDELSTTDSDDSSCTDSSEESLHKIPLPASKKSDESILQNPFNVKDAAEHEDFTFTEKSIEQSLNETFTIESLDENTGTAVHYSDAAEYEKYPLTAESTAVYSIVQAVGTDNWNFLPMSPAKALKNLDAVASAGNSADEELSTIDSDDSFSTDSCERPLNETFTIESLEPSLKENTGTAVHKSEQAEQEGSPFIFEPFEQSNEENLLPPVNATLSSSTTKDSAENADSPFTAETPIVQSPVERLAGSPKELNVASLTNASTVQDGNCTAQGTLTESPKTNLIEQLFNSEGLLFEYSNISKIRIDTTDSLSFEFINPAVYFHSKHNLYMFRGESREVSPPSMNSTTQTNETKDDNDKLVQDKDEVNVISKNDVDKKDEAEDSINSEYESDEDGKSYEGDYESNKKTMIAPKKKKYVKIKHKEKPKPIKQKGG